MKWQPRLLPQKVSKTIHPLTCFSSKFWSPSQHDLAFADAVSFNLFPTETLDDDRCEKLITKIIHSVLTEFGIALRLCIVGLFPSLSVMDKLLLGPYFVLVKAKGLWSFPWFSKIQSLHLSCGCGKWISSHPEAGWSMSPSGTFRNSLGGFLIVLGQLRHNIRSNFLNC